MGETKFPFYELGQQEQVQGCIRYNCVIGDAEFERHKTGHIDSNKILTENEFDELNDVEHEFVRCGHDTPRRQDFMKRYILRKI